MSQLDESFAILLGRQATDQEKQALQRVKEALGIKPNDALWLVLMALEHYQKLYNDIPGRIEEITRSLLYRIQDAADATMREAASVAKMEMTQAMGETAAQVAQQTADAQLKRSQQEVAARHWQSMIKGIIVATLGVLISAGGGYLVGKEVARAEAISIARQEADAASWAATPGGQLAYRWAQTGELQRLARCEDQTLTRDRQQGRAVCLAKKGSGWWLP